jgi:iron complex transport system ATP-binding protein
MDLRTEKLQLGYGKQTVINDLDLSVPAGKITSLVGRNGSGKSTLLRAMGRLMSPQRGRIVIDGKAIAEYPTRELAKLLSVLPQAPSAPPALTVRELAQHGRYPYGNFFGITTDRDHRIIDWAIEQTGMLSFANRPLATLSGGQRQRAWIAMALAQDTEIMLLDEPTTFLDVAYQLELMELMRHLNKSVGRTILMVLHDLNQAAQYSDLLVAIKDGSIHSTGPPREVLTEAMVREVFGVDCDVTVDRRTGNPICLPYGLAANAHDGSGGDLPMESGQAEKIGNHAQS